MLDSVLNMSKKQIEDAIRILNPCMNDYLYVFDFKEDYYVKACNRKVYSSI